MDELRGELGDLLFQSVFHAQMADDAGHFNFSDVARTMSDKMVARHPHVFGTESRDKSADQQTADWEVIKAAERAGKDQGRALDGVAVGLPALLPVGVAVVFALFMLVTRAIAKDVDPIGLQALSGVMAVPAVGLAMILFPETPLLALRTIPDNAWLLLAILGCMGTVAHLLMTWSLRFAPSTTLAPMQYLEIPIGTLIGYLIFHDLPNGLAAVGICITIAAGLYVIVRERAISRRPAIAPLS